MVVTEQSWHNAELNGTKKRQHQQKKLKHERTNWVRFRNQSYVFVPSHSSFLIEIVVSGKRVHTLSFGCFRNHTKFHTTFVTIKTGFKTNTPWTPHRLSRHIYVPFLRKEFLPVPMIQCLTTRMRQFWDWYTSLRSVCQNGDIKKRLRLQI